MKRLRNWIVGLERKAPRVSVAVSLLLAAVLMFVHYAFGEWIYHSEVRLWCEPAFWSGAVWFLGLPPALWAGWRLASFGRLEPSGLLLALAFLICAGDAICYSIPSVLIHLEASHYCQFKSVVKNWHWGTYWDWWTFWMPAATLMGNVLYAWRWWRSFSRSKFAVLKSNAAMTKATWGKMILDMSAVTAASAAVLATAIYVGLPRDPINDTTLSLAATFLVPTRLEDDFEYVISTQGCHGARLGAVLDHVKLADLQRQHFYAGLDRSTYQAFVLSPYIDELPVRELQWRRTLWDYFCPQVQNENDPVKAARIVVRSLREHVGIDPSYQYRVGVETIWTQQMTDRRGFERIYVAALRSVGIAARLSEQQQAELWTGMTWEIAPKTLESF